MANLSADASIRILGTAYTERFHVDSAAARTIYKGQPMIVDQDVDATGNIVQFVTAVVVAATDVFVGIAAEGHTTAASASETDQSSWIELYVEPTIVGFVSSGVVTDGTHLGKTVYMSDSATLDITTSSQNVQIGKAWRVLGDYVYVKLESPKICASA